MEVTRRDLLIVLGAVSIVLVILLPSLLIKPGSGQGSDKSDIAKSLRSDTEERYQSIIFL